MASSWERALENVKFSGFRTVGTVSCRVLTGTLALLSLAQPQKGAALAAFAARESDSHRYIPKMKAIPEPNVYSLWLKDNQKQQMISSWTPSANEGTTWQRAIYWS